MCTAKRHPNMIRVNFTSKIFLVNLSGCCKRVRKENSIVREFSQLTYFEEKSINRFKITIQH